VTPKQFRDFARFTRVMVGTQDLDPIYPLLRYMIRSARVDREPAHWLLYLYLSSYNVVTAWEAFQRFPDPVGRDGGKTFEREFMEWWVRTEPRVNVERRGLRGDRIGHALFPYISETSYDTQVGWLGKGIASTDSYTNYEALWIQVQTLPQVGRWAAFKWLDLLQHVLDYPIAPPDMRLADCSGPREALEALYVERLPPGYWDGRMVSRVGVLNQLAHELREGLATLGVEVTWDVLETVLCNFYSMMKGKYYCGHDIDEHLHDMAESVRIDVWLNARSAVFDRRLLGEIGNRWHGIREDLMSLYKRAGQVHCDLEGA